MLKCVAKVLHESAKKLDDDKIDFDCKDAWGYLVSIDLVDCDHKKISGKDNIEKYIKELSKVIDCHLYGSPTIAYIGEGKRLLGWSFTQLVTTSSITGHFIENNNSAYIDIFFCNYFDPDKVVKFTKDYFEAKDLKINLLTRGKR